MASNVIYTASWSANKWVDWLTGGRRRWRNKLAPFDLVALPSEIRMLVSDNPQMSYLAWELARAQMLEIGDHFYRHSIKVLAFFHPGTGEYRLSTFFGNCSNRRAHFWHFIISYLPFKPHIKIWQCLKEYSYPRLRRSGRFPPYRLKFRLIIKSDMVHVPWGLWLSEQLN